MLCMRPHTVQICSTNERDAVLATIVSGVWRGATTRVQLDVNGLPIELTADVPGPLEFVNGAVVGVRLPDPAGVLIPAAVGATPGASA
jgi:2-aminoethylphosphonate transport system ATP-binding protein